MVTPASSPLPLQKNKTVHVNAPPSASPPRLCTIDPAIPPLLLQQKRPRRVGGVVAGVMESGNTLLANRAPSDQRQRRRRQDNFGGEGGAVEMRGLLSPIDEAP